MPSYNSYKSCNSYNSYHNPSIPRERRNTGCSQSYIHPPRSFVPQGRPPWMPPLIHQDYRPSRRWPPSPVAEDEAISLSKEYMPSLPDIFKEEARYRGEIDQQPLIVAVHLPPSTRGPPSRGDISAIDDTSLQSNSSSEVSSPRTPLDNDSDSINVDRRYVYIPEKGIEIPSTYNEPRTPKYEKKSQIPQDLDSSRSRKELSRLETNLSPAEPLRDRPSRYERAPSPYAYTPKTSKTVKDPALGENLGSQDTDASRGRKELSRLETNLSSAAESGRDRSFRYERAPSPYAYTPKPSRTVKDPALGQSLDSADVMSPRAGFNVGSARAASNAPRHDPSWSGRAVGTQPMPPSMRRHVSDTGYSSKHPSAGEHGTIVPSTPYPVSSDESDLSADESPSRMRNGMGLISPRSPPKYSMPRHEDFSKRRTDRPLDASLPPVPVESIKGVTPTYMNIPSSPGLKIVNGQPPTPGAQFENMPLPSPGSQYNHMSPSKYTGERRDSPQRSGATSATTSPPVTPETTDVHLADHTTKAKNIPPGVGYSLRHPSKPKSPDQHLGSPESQNSSESVSNMKKLQSPTKSRSHSPESGGVTYTQAVPSIGLREPSPARPNKTTHPVPEAMLVTSSQRVSLTPFLSPQAPDLGRPTAGTRRRALSNVDTRPKISFTESHPEMPVLPPPSPQAKSRSASHHRTVSFGSQPPDLLPCPRPSPVAGYTDWYSLIGNSSFSICPSCRRSVFGAGYEKHFKPSRPDSSGSKRRCDMSTPWMQLALLHTMSTRRPDTKLLYDMADIVVNELPCPGKAPTAGSWFRVVRPEDGKQVSGFDVCPCCVRNIETMFPALRGVYQKSRSRHPDQERSCDLRTDSKRFAMYIDLMESTAKHAEEFKRPPNMLRFTDLADKMAAIPECSRDDMLLEQAWHIMPHIPELTVCEDCYHEVVRPAAKQGYSLAGQFSRTVHCAGPTSCQLYSARMRDAFIKACRRNDITELKSVAQQRHHIETDLQRRIQEIRRAEMEDGERLARIRGLVEEWKRWQ